MKQAIRLIVPGNAVAKGRPRLGKWGVYTPKATTDFEKRVGYIAKAAMRGESPMDMAVRLVLHIAVQPPKSWSNKDKQSALSGLKHPIGKADLDNEIKALADAMNGIVYQDDNQIIEIFATKSYQEAAEIRISVEEI